MKKFLIISSFLILSSTVGATSVGGSIGGWNVVSQVARGIGQKLTATKEVMINGSSKLITGTANITPNPGSVAKFMARAGGVALVLDAMDLVLDGVDYVMDPVNNTVIYKKQPETDTLQNYHYYRYCSPLTSCFGTIEGLRKSVDNYYTSSEWDNCRLSGDLVLCHVKNIVSGGESSDATAGVRSVNPAYNPQAENPSKPVTVPLSNVASQVIDQAEKDIKAGNPASPAVALTRAAAEAEAKEAETDAKKSPPIVSQFESNPSYPTTEESTGTGETVTDPVTGESSSSFKFEWVKACDWFPQACEFFEWVKKDPNLEDMEVPEKDLEKKEIKDDLVEISGRSCPTDVKFDVDGLPFGIKVNKSYSMQEICNTVEPLKYVFQLITAVICALILLRV